MDHLASKTHYGLRRCSHRRGPTRCTVSAVSTLSPSRHNSRNIRRGDPWTEKCLRGKQPSRRYVACILSQLANRQFPTTHHPPSNRTFCCHQNQEWPSIRALVHPLPCRILNLIKLPRQVLVRTSPSPSCSNRDRA